MTTTLSPSQMEELAQWHDERGREYSASAEQFKSAPSAKDWAATANRHAQSAAIIRWAAKVLEAEPVGVVTNEWGDPEEFAERGLECNGPVIQKAAIGAQLIIKPTFGDDNEQS